jgi:hypothetical protein
MIIKSKRMKCVEHAVLLGKKRNAYRILVGKPEELLRGPKHGWENHIKMDCKETVKECGLDSSGSG